MWNVKLRKEDGIPRTNNKLEGWHRGLLSMFDYHTLQSFVFFWHYEEKKSKFVISFASRSAITLKNKNDQYNKLTRES